MGFKKNIKAFIKSNPSVSGVLSVLYNASQQWKPPIIDINLFTEKVLASTGNVFFVQIGANDGTSGCDHLRHNIINKNWKGILIEPVPHIFKNLVSNYKDIPGLAFENVAVGNKDGFQTFYHFDQQMSSWHNELGSFKREVLYRHGIDNVDALIKELEVPVVKLDSLLKKYNNPTVHLLNIDTEGYDYEILKTIDFTLIKPVVIIYEHRHLSIEDYKASIIMLKKNGYMLYSEHDADTIAVLKK